MSRLKKKHLEGWDGEVSPRNAEVRRRFISMLTYEGRVFFTSDDFRDFGLVPYVQGDHKHAIGAIFSSMVRKGLAEPTGQFVRSRRGKNKGRHVQVFRRPKQQKLEAAT